MVFLTSGWCVLSACILSSSAPVPQAGLADSWAGYTGREQPQGDMHDLRPEAERVHGALWCVPQISHVIFLLSAPLPVPGNTQQLVSCSCKTHMLINEC